VEFLTKRSDTTTTPESSSSNDNDSNSFFASSSSKGRSSANDSKTLVLLHGRMGDREEWDHAAEILAQSLPSE
jgi:hypothetical protein